MNKHIRKYAIRNGYIRKNAMIACIKDKAIESLPNVKGPN